MNLKIDDIKPALPGETLRKIDMRLARIFKHEKHLTKYGITDEGHFFAETMPLPYTTSVDAALELLEKIGCKWWLGSHIFEYNAYAKYYQIDLEYKGSIKRINAESFHDIPCAVVRALLRSQNVSEVEV